MSCFMAPRQALVHPPSGALMFLFPALSCSDTFTEGRSWGSEICCGSEICSLHAGLCVSYRRCKCAYGNLAASAGHAVPNWTGAWRSTPHTDQLFSEGNRPKRTNDDLRSWWLPRKIDWWVLWVCRKRIRISKNQRLGSICSPCYTGQLNKFVFFSIPQWVGTSGNGISHSERSVCNALFKAIPQRKRPEALDSGHAV